MSAMRDPGHTSPEKVIPDDRRYSKVSKLHLLFLGRFGYEIAIRTFEISFFVLNDCVVALPELLGAQLMTSDLRLQ